MKYIYMCLLVIIGISSESFADTGDFPSGIYLGFAGGYNMRYAKVDNVNANEDGEDLLNFDSKNNNVGSLALAGLIGYLHRIQNFTIGGEAFYSFMKGEKEYEDTRQDPNGNNFRFKINSRDKDRREFGFKFILGYIIQECYHLYGLAGFSRSDYANFNTLTVTDFANGQITTSSLTKRNSVTNFLLGLGLEKAFQDFRIGVDWLYKFGSDKNSLENATRMTAAGENVRAGTRTKTRNSQIVMFKVVYNFGNAGFGVKA